MYETKTFTMADGKAYHLSPVSLGAHRRYIEERKTDESNVPLMRFIHTSLSKVHPDVTIEQVENELLTYTNLLLVTDAVLEVSGLGNKTGDQPGELSPAPAN